MEPSHRLACLEFRRFGLVLPFGAANNWFNTPNRTLFSPAGRWLQNDLADPLDSWEFVYLRICSRFKRLTVTIVYLAPHKL